MLGSFSRSVSIGVCPSLKNELLQEFLQGSTCAASLLTRIKDTVIIEIGSLEESFVAPAQTPS